MSHTLGNFELAPEDWSTLRGLLTQALALGSDEREPWLDRLPEPQRRFAHRLRALLAHADDSAALLDGLPKVETDTFAVPLPSSGDMLAAPGRQVGPYRLIAPLGEGGMASVWLAERGDLLQSRKVALKLPHGAWRQSVWSERLAREREILATLSHPNIAALYDAGIHDGRPWLALEHVDGVPLDAHCSAHALDLRARLALFLQVADAVAHAHARLVVHRDLKPSNILVRDDGQVRLLDFGIAKLLDQGEAQETALTRETGRALTPDYAAPEQIAGRPIGTAADIYSLGVLLYELLAGTRPYRLKRGSRAELEEAILAAEPVRPSDAAADAKRRGQLRGDLDTIVMKALKKSPADRYGSVVELAEDIRRYLDGQPVKAQADRWTYRSAKFIARHRVGVAAGALALGAVLGGSALALWQAVEAGHQRDAALQQQRRAEAFSEFMYVLLDDLGGSQQPLTMTALLDRGTAMLEQQQAMDPALTAYLQYEMSRKYTMVNQSDRVLALLQRSAEGARASGDHGLLAATQCAAAWSLAEGQHAQAQARLAEADRALALASVVPLFARADCHRARARVQRAAGDLDGAIATLQRGLVEVDRAGVDLGSRRRIMRVQLSDLYRAGDRFKEALALSGEELDHVRRAGRLDSLAGLVALNNHAGNLNRLGEHLEAQALLDQAQAWLQQRPPSNSAAVGFASNYGGSLLRLGHAARALELADEELPKARAANNVFRVSVAQLLAARALLALARPEEAQARLAEAEAIWLTDARAHARMLQEAALVRAELLLHIGRVVAAREAIEAALTKAGYPAALQAWGVDRLLRAASRIHARAGDAHRAEAAAGAALEYSRRIARDERRSGDVGEAALLRARARLALGRSAEALQDVQLARAALAHALGPAHASTVAADTLLSELSKGS